MNNKTNPFNGKPVRPLIEVLHSLSGDNGEYELQTLRMMFDSFIYDGTPVKSDREKLDDFHSVLSFTEIITELILSLEGQPKMKFDPVNGSSLN